MNLDDFLFRIGLNKGTKVLAPSDLFDLHFEYYDSKSFISFDEWHRNRIRNYYISVQKHHHLTIWLQECEGLWKTWVDKETKLPYVVFSRKVDAGMFRIMS